MTADAITDKRVAWFIEKPVRLVRWGNYEDALKVTIYDPYESRHGLAHRQCFTEYKGRGISGSDEVLFRYAHIRQSR